MKTLKMSGCSFGEAVKVVRINMNLTQNGMSAFLGVPVSTYKAWEYDKCLPSVDNINLLYRKIKKIACIGEATAEAVRDIAIRLKLER